MIISTKMSDNEIEDVSFLPGASNSKGSGKRSVYEPTGKQKCRQIVCSQNRAILIVSIFVIIILIISLIAALARPGGCPGEKTRDDKQDNKQDYIATNGEKFPYRDIKLPQDTVPVSYSIFLHPNLKTFLYKGSVNITIEVKKSTDFIIYHSKDLNYTKHKLYSKNGDEVEITKFLEYTRNQQIYLKLKNSLSTKLTYTLMLDFNGAISEQLMGFYKSSYKNDAGETRWLATTHFEPTDARAAFPCYDEPSFKAKFSMKMVRTEDYISLFNTQKVNTEEYDSANKLYMDTFDESVKMSTYLVAFVVCDYKSITKETSSSGVKVSVYTPPNQISQAQFALDSATSILEYYEDFFGQPYPMPKQDLIAIPDFSAGAMENWGLITYRLTALLYDENASSYDSQQWVAIVVAHELAHQWFGNLVTMAWWNDLWLNEGFASFMEYIGVNQIKPEWKMMDQYITSTFTQALSADSLSTSHPISVEVNDPSEINEIFDRISYEKGSSVIRMMENFLGESTLKKGLQNYLNKYKYSNAATEDLWASMSEQAQKEGKDVDVTKVMDTWTKQMGYPVISVTKTGNTFTATQDRFLLNPNGTLDEEFTSPFNYAWKVPLTYYTDKTSTTKSQWMNDKSVDLPVNDSPGWIKLNANTTGYYRVHYDANNWQAIIDQLMNDHTVFAPADRAGLLDDAFSLASSGHLDVKMALELSKYLTKEDDYVPWSAGVGKLWFIGQLLEDKPEFVQFSTYMKNLMKTKLDAVNWDSNIDHLSKYLRELVLENGVKLNYEPVVTRVKNIFDEWMNDGTKINADLKGVVFRTGVKYGGEAEWQFVFNKFQESGIPSEKTALMYSLATTTDAMRLNRYLYMTLDPKKVRKGDTVMVISHIAANPGGKVLAWRFVKQNWDTLQERYGEASFDMPRLVKMTTRKFTTQYDYDEVKAFFGEHETASAKRAVKQTLESINLNINWLKLNEKKVVEWLKKENGSS